jgi:release factor glutamine methyltransferase
VTTVATALADARRRGVASLDAQLLLARLLATTRTRLIAHDERVLTLAESARWQEWVERRLGDEPIAYLLGEKEFHGLALEIDRSVLVPRPETELLVDWACEAVSVLDSGRSPGGPVPPVPIRVVDLGTGSGAIALALKRAHPHCQVTGTDVSAAALALARRNAERLGLAIELREASWWHGLAGRRFDLAVANPPYIAADDPHLAMLRHEPEVALTPGGDGLGALRAIVAGASAPLVPGGWLLLEHGFDQAAAVREMLAGAGFGQVETRRDLAGHERATGGRRPSS